MLAAQWRSAALGLAMAVSNPFAPYCQAVETRGASAAGTAVEELVYARADDGIVDAGALFTPPGSVDKRIAVIWIHGSGVNFYYPSYVKVARELARRGLTTIVGNTRMHDLGNIEAFRETANARGGSYWGITTDQVRDLGAWVQLAKDRGFDRVILVGHSAGATAVQIYTARTQDPRIAGMVLAPDGFVRDQARSSTPPVARVRVPILAWFGTDGDVGTAEDLELLETTLKKLRGGPSRVSTAMIPQATHMFDGHETQVAQVLANWVNSVVLAGR